MTPREAPEARHLDVEEYPEDERVEAPPWYDDTINVGEVTNAETGEKS